MQDESWLIGYGANSVFEEDVFNTGSKEKQEITVTPWNQWIKIHMNRNAAKKELDE